MMAAIERLLARLDLQGKEPMAELARTLACALDADDPDATLAGIAAVSKELRAVLADLEKPVDDGDDDLAEFRRVMSS